MEGIKYLNLEEFINEGYLQEVNRRFFHPLGLALEVETDDMTGKKSISGIWDYRHDNEGIYFDYKNSSEERKEKAKKKKENIDQKFYLNYQNRYPKLGFFIEPVI